jgi:tetratricopeptide (TPR) repeat protein
VKVLAAGLVLLAIVTPTSPVLAGESSGPAGDPAAGGAAFQFALAKMLTEEGQVLAALEAFPEAVRLAPEDPYIRLEYAELLLRVAQRYGSGAGRTQRLAEAADQVAAARKLAPDDLDTLRAVGQIDLALADFRPQALDDAIEALEAVRKRAPDDAQTMVTLGQVYLQQQQADRAVEVFREAASYTPGNRMIYSFLADALHAAGRDDEAEEPQRKLLDLDPRALDARLALAKAMARRGDHRGAAALLREAPPEVAKSREIRSELVWQLYLAGDYDQALSELDGVQADTPDEAWPHFLRALVHAGQGKNDEALHEIDALRADDPDNFELARAAASVLEKQGRGDAAAQVLGDLLARLDAAGDEKSAETRTRLRLLLAGVQERAGQREAAMATLKPLLDAPADDVRGEARMANADLLYDLGRHDEALASLDEAVGKLPALRAKQIELLLRAGDEKRARKLISQVQKGDDLDVVVMAAQAAQSQHRWELSLPLLERAMAEGEPRVPVFFMAGTAYERTGRREQAAAAFQKLLARKPDFAPALNYLGYMWAEKGEHLPEALEMVKKAVSLDPDNGAYVDSLGWAQYQLGRYDDAKRDLERAHDLMPDDATICEHLADVYAALGDVVHAEQLYRRALDLAADDAADVRRKLERLRVD